GGAWMAGFMPGTVALWLVRKMYGRGLAYEVAEKSIQQTFDKEVAQNDAYDVLGMPKLTVLDYEDIDGEMRAVVRFGVRPEFELKDITGEKVTRVVHEVTDEDVEREIDRHRRSDAVLEPLEGEATDETLA